MNDDTSSTKVTDLDVKRNQRRVTDALNNLLKDARNGKTEGVSGTIRPE